MDKNIIKPDLSKKRLVHLVPGYEDSWAFKDGVQLLLSLKETLDADAELVTFNNSPDYSLTESLLKVDVLTRSRSFKTLNTLKILYYLFKHRNRVTFLFQFGLTWQSLLFAGFYKFFNSNGYAYIKFDNSIHSGIQYYWWNYFSEESTGSFKDRVKKRVINALLLPRIDLFSIEDTDSLEFIRDKIPQISDRIILIQNGIDFRILKGISVSTIESRENLILTVGRIGSYAKATDIFLKAIGQIPQEDLRGWKIIFAGKIEEGFMSSIDDFYNEYPSCAEYVVFAGEQNRQELYNLYNRAKIFVLPSRWEGFANVFSESMYFGLPIITTERVAPKNVIRDKMGLIIPHESASDLAIAVSNLVKDSEKRRIFSEFAVRYAKENLDWSLIVNQIAERFRSSKR